MLSWLATLFSLLYPVLPKKAQTKIWETGITVGQVTGVIPANLTGSSFNQSSLIGYSAPKSITTTHTKTHTTVTNYHWQPDDWTQVEETMREKREANRWFLTNMTDPKPKKDRSAHKVRRALKLTRAVSAVIMSSMAQTLLEGEYPESLKTHVTTECSWISPERLEIELQGETTSCRLVPGQENYLHCTDEFSGKTCRLPIPQGDRVSQDFLSRRATVTGEILAKSGLGLNLIMDEDTPSRKELQYEVDKVWQRLPIQEETASGVPQLEDGLIQFSKKAISQIQEAIEQDPMIVQVVDEDTMKVLTQPGDLTELLRALGPQALSYFSLYQPTNQEPEIGRRKQEEAAYQYLNQYIESSAADSWTHDKEGTWQQYHRDEKTKKMAFSPRDLEFVIQEMDKRVRVSADKERRRRSASVNDTILAMYYATWPGANDTHLLRDDGGGEDPRCGPLAGPQGHFECDRFSRRPCCSGLGFCGFSSNHCNCHNCRDYRPPNYNAVRVAAGLTERKMRRMAWDPIGDPGTTTTTPKTTSAAPVYSAHEGMANRGRRSEADSQSSRSAFDGLDPAEKYTIEDAIRRGDSVAGLRYKDSLGRRWQVDNHVEGVISWKNKHTFIEYDSLGAIVLVDDVSPVVNLLERIVHYNTKKRVTFSADDNNYLRKTKVYYANVGVRSPLSLFGNHSAENNTRLDQDVSSGWAANKRYSRIPFWIANDRTIEGDAQEAEDCLEQLLQAVKMFHPLVDKRVRRQILSLIVAGLGAAMGLAGLGAGVSATSAAATNHDSIVDLSTKLVEVQAGVLTLSKKQELGLTVQHAILEVLDDISQDMREEQRESLALATQSLLGQSTRKMCSESRRIIENLELLRKGVLPLSMVNEGLIQGALERVNRRAKAVGLRPAVTTVQQFLQLPTTSLFANPEKKSDDQKSKYQEHVNTIEGMKIPTFYTRANVSQDFEHPNVEHHNGTSGLISEEATGPGFFKPHHLFLEVRTHLPLIRDSQEAYLVQTLKTGLLKIDEDYFTLEHDGWLAINEDEDKMFQLPADYFKDCIEANGRYTCPRKPRGQGDDCLVNLKKGQENKKCLNRMRALDKTKPYLVKSDDKENEAIAFVPQDHNVVLRCPAPKYLATNLTLEWQVPRNQHQGLIRYRAPYDYCSVQINRNGEVEDGPTVYFMPPVEEEIQLGKKTELRDVYVLLGLYDTITRQIRRKTGYSLAYQHAQEVLGRANLTMKEIEAVAQYQPWDYIQLSPSHTRLAISIGILAAGLFFASLLVGGCICYRKNAKRAKRVRSALLRDRALRAGVEQQQQEQALINRHAVRYV